MPQENQVLRCFSCETFQVHLVKKAKKWECKICGAKQSFKRHYGKGSGKDCRNHVMKLNELRLTYTYSENLADEITEEIPLKAELIPVEEKKGSKWAQYLDDDNDNEDEAFHKPEKKRKISEDSDEVVKGCKESDSDWLSQVSSNDTENTKCSTYEENTIQKKKSKNIFDYDLDNTDFLNFI